MNSSVYDHLPLEQKHIRLVRVLPGPYHEEIRCDLVEALLDERLGGTYEALSYTWGDISVSTTISCNGKPFYVGMNVEQALRKIRTEEEARVIWIDTISVDQSNTTERGEQVQLMAEIYTRAKRAVIWLGPEKDYSDAAMEYISKIDADLYLRELGEYLRYRIKRERNTRDWVLAPSLDLKQDTNIQRALDCLLGRPWFRRVWIQQEAVFCPDMIVICGGATVSWKQFSAFVWAINREREAGNPFLILWTPPAPEALNLTLTIQTNRDFRAMLRDDDTSPRLLCDLLFESIRCEATDPRDKVFAFLGLVQDSESSFWDPKPSYHSSAKEVYQDVATRYLERRVCGLIMYAGRSSQSLLGLPSWTPDWSGCNIGSIFQNSLSLPSWRASGLLEPYVRIADREGQRVLLTYGTIVDSITQATGTPELSGHNPVNYPGWPEDKAKLLRHERDSARAAHDCKRYDNGSRGDAYRRTLIANLGPGRVAATASESSLESYEEWLTWLEKGSAGDCKTPAPDYSQFVSVSEAFWATQFCTSRTGYMCLASKDTKPGDLISIITGVQVPIIIRAHGDSSLYEIIGPCYVHDIMGGEEAPVDNPFQIEMYMGNDPPSERLEVLRRAQYHYRVNSTPSKNLGPIYDLYRNYFSSRQLYEMGLPPRRTTGRLALVLGDFPQALHTQFFPGYDQPFHLDVGDLVWIFNASPLSCIGINGRGEIGGLSPMWIVAVDIGLKDEVTPVQLPPGWIEHDREGSAPFKEYRHADLGITSYVSPLFLDGRVGPVPAGWIAGRREMRDAGEARRTYFIHQWTGETTFEDPCLRETEQARNPNILGFI